MWCALAGAFHIFIPAINHEGYAPFLEARAKKGTVTVTERMIQDGGRQWSLVGPDWVARTRSAREALEINRTSDHDRLSQELHSSAPKHFPSLAHRQRPRLYSGYLPDRDRSVLGEAASLTPRHGGQPMMVGKLRLRPNRVPLALAICRPALQRARIRSRSSCAKADRKARMPLPMVDQQVEALRRLAAGESCRSIAKTMAVHHATVARLAG